MIDLKSIVKDSAEIVEEFPGFSGFEVTLCYPGQNVLEKIRKEATVQKFNRQTRKPEEDLDTDKFIESFTAAVIKGWKGLTVSYLREIALVDAEGLEDEQEIPYSTDNAVVLMKNSRDFDSWVVDITTDMGNFTKRR